MVWTDLARTPDSTDSVVAAVACLWSIPCGASCVALLGCFFSRLSAHCFDCVCVCVYVKPAWLVLEVLPPTWPPLFDCRKPPFLKSRRRVGGVLTSLLSLGFSFLLYSYVKTYNWIFLFLLYHHVDYSLLSLHTRQGSTGWALSMRVAVCCRIGIVITTSKNKRQQKQTTRNQRYSNRMHAGKTLFDFFIRLDAPVSCDGYVFFLPIRLYIESWFVDSKCSCYLFSSNSESVQLSRVSKNQHEVIRRWRTLSFLFFFVDPEKNSRRESSPFCWPLPTLSIDWNIRELFSQFSFETRKNLDKKQVSVTLKPASPIRPK